MSDRHVLGSGEVALVGRQLSESLVCNDISYFNLILCIVRVISDLTWGELVLHDSEHAVRLQADETDREDGGQVRLPAALVLQYKHNGSNSAPVNHRTNSPLAA